METNANNVPVELKHDPQIPQRTQSNGFLANAQEFFMMAQTLSRANIIPKEFQGKPENVFVALEMAHRLGIGPMEAMQNLYVVHGTPALSAKFLIGLANRSGRFKGGLRFREEGEGKTLAVTCYASDRETGEELDVTVTMEQAVTAGWAKNQKYREMPQQMLSYRAATFFVRRFCPEVMLGMPTVDEAEEMPPPRDTDAMLVEKLKKEMAEAEAAQMAAITGATDADTSPADDPVEEGSVGDEELFAGQPDVQHSYDPDA